MNLAGALEDCSRLDVRTRLSDYARCFTAGVQNTEKLVINLPVTDTATCVYNRGRQQCARQLPLPRARVYMGQLGTKPIISWIKLMSILATPSLAQGLVSFTPRLLRLTHRRVPKEATWF